MKYVVVGAGPSGVIAAETLKQQDSGAEITIVGDEPEVPYSRMAIPYYLVGRVGEDGTHLRHGKSHYRDNNINILQDRVVSVDPAAGQLSLGTGGSMPFDRLLVATGSRPVKLPIPGADLPGVESCWTLADSRAIIKKAKKGANVVLLGAGFIGSIILESLARRGVNLSVIELGDRMVPRMMDDVAGNMIKEWCHNKGVSVYTSVAAEAIQKKGDALEVHVAGGKVLPADLVISAVGVKPCIDFLDGSGVKTNQGVLVNRNMQSSAANVYAAGDVCEGLDFSTGGYNVHAIQPTAADHARSAALNMSGRNVPFIGSVVMNVLDTLGLISSSFGLWQGAEGGDSSQLVDKDKFRYIKLQFAEDRLVGAQAIGLTEHVGVLRGLIQTRIRLGKWKKHLLEDPTKIMEAYLGCTQPVAFNAGILRKG